MGLSDLTSNLFSFIAIIISVLAFIKSNKHSYASTELAVGNAISEARKRVEDIGVAITHLKDLYPEEDAYKEKQEYKFLSFTLKSDRENLLNVYEHACALYIDKKIDQNRFEKAYRREIRNLVEQKEFDEKLGTVGTPFKCIISVYNKWENTEK